MDRQPDEGPQPSITIGGLTAVDIGQTPAGREARFWKLWDEVEVDFERVDLFMPEHRQSLEIFRDQVGLVRAVDLPAGWPPICEVQFPSAGLLRTLADIFKRAHS